MLINKGDVYVPKGKRDPTYAFIVEGVQEGRVFVRDTSENNTEIQFQAFVYQFVWDFLRYYEKAKLEQLTGIITNLKKNQRIVSQKLNLLEHYAQSQPKYTKESKLGDSGVDEGHAHPSFS